MATTDETWTCECGFENTTKFCGDCGKPRPDDTSNNDKHDKADKDDDFLSEVGEAVEEIVESAAKSGASQAARTISREIVNDAIKAIKK